MTNWTLVSRAKGGRFFRPVADVPAGLGWFEVQDLQLPNVPGVEVWCVPAEADYVWDDDGKRFPIRWDASPALTVPAHVLAASRALDDDADAYADRCRD